MKLATWLLLASLIGCTTTTESSTDTTSLIGPVTAGGSFTCDLDLPLDALAMPIAAVIDRDRMFMAERPGMRQKHLPLRIDPVGQRIRSGGRYLFDSYDNAKNYLRFVTEQFALDGTLFLDRSYFIANDCHAWKVIGAYDFAPFDKQVIVRTERYKAEGNLQAYLQTRWPALQARAAAAGLSSVWLLYSRDEQLVQIVYFRDRVLPSPAFDAAGLELMETQAPLGPSIATGSWQKTLDVTHFVFNIWFPFEPGDSGAAPLWPHTPPLPSTQCGDGLCSPSAGEDNASCAADCTPACGDATCDADEDNVACPSDCRYY